MPQTAAISVENNFTKGLITEATALNFPENAATDCDNCEFSIVGDVHRRLGMDYEANYLLAPVDATNQAVSTYKWNNVGGTGSVQFYVSQIGNVVYFYNITNVTPSSSISSNILPSRIFMTNFLPDGATIYDYSAENQYTEGNGYLFIFNKNCDPIYCSYINGSVTAARIPIQIRDFQGIVETGIDVTTRPATLTNLHNYNLQNQGWTQGQAWNAVSSDPETAYPVGIRTWNIASGIAAVTPGQVINIRGSIPGNNSDYCQLSGTVISYIGTLLSVNVFSVFTTLVGSQFNSWNISPVNTGYISTWVGALLNYPSNADVWWYFKNASGAFDPGTTQPNVSLSAGDAPKGHFLLNPFNQDRSAVSGVSGLSTISTSYRPTVGTWFQGRVWYTGVNSSRDATIDFPFYTWSENIYFSQVNIGTSTKFGNCFQENDPTSDRNFDILPTDGGVIQIQGSGVIYKLFPIQNGMLVFAANGVWFITGSQGIGFAANDYTITKISSVESISSTSFVDVQGLPYFWNEEGIYMVSPQQGGGLSVEPITVSTILDFYNQIPRQSKRYARGAYHPIDYVIEWIYKSADETDLTSRYTFDRILNYNTYNKAFYPYSVDSTSSQIKGITYVQGPGSQNAFLPTFKFFTTKGVLQSTISDINNDSYFDWSSSGTPADYTSYFVTGYRIRGQAIRKYQPQYIQVYSIQDDVASAYKIQGIWDYSNDRNSGRWSSIQYIDNALTRFNTAIRRHKIRGRGYALQFKISSASGRPFSIIGWSASETVNQGV